MKDLKFHQGDVIGKMIESIPENAIPVSNYPIALGSSNHAHALTGNVQRFELGSRILYRVEGNNAILQHTNASNLDEKTWLADYPLPVQDHGYIELENGCYEFWIQKAYNPYKKIMEKVID